MAGGTGEARPGLMAAISREARRLREEGLWTELTEHDLDERFADAARAALMAPAVLERSLRLRRIARRLVPEPARPLLRRGARLFDHGLRAILKLRRA